MSAGQKKHFLVSQQNFIAQKLAAFARQAGQAWPCHVTKIVSPGIVEIAFDVNSGILTLPRVICPVAESAYVKLPIQVGDRGVALSADVSLAPSSGLGPPGTTSMTNLGNLTSLIYFPIGNTNWSTPDANAVVVSGPRGVILKNDAGTVEVHLDQSGNATVTASGTATVTAATLTATISGTATINAANIALNGVLTINGTPYLAHVHTLVQTGSSDSGPVGP
jgi:hypothetical protein